jgi:SAM-dependent methyltransferase
MTGKRGAAVKSPAERQEEEYAFPYHYVSQFRGGFSQCFNDSWGINYVSTIEFLLDKLKRETFEALIDIGCGDGRFTAELSKEFPFAEISGIDSSRRAVGLARALNKGLEFKLFDIGREQASRRADGAVLMEVFEHIEPDRAREFVAGVAGIVRPGGFLYVTVPHINKPVEYKHYRHFSVDSLTEAFHEYFRLAEVVPFERSSWRRRAINRILTNRFFILNHGRTRNTLYRHVKKTLFFATEKDCQRVFARFVRRTE